MARTALFQLPGPVLVLKSCLFSAIVLCAHIYVVIPCVDGLIASASSGYGQALRGGPRRLQQQQPAGSELLGQVIGMAISAIFSGLFYVQVTSKYPVLNGRTSSGVAQGIMAQNSAFRINAGPICFQTCCCLPSIVSHVFDRTGVLNYWVACIGATCGFGGCMTCYASLFTDMPEKLGGQKREMVDAFGIGCCCSPCEWCKYAEALDAATGSQTGCFSFTQSGPMQTMAVGMVVAPEQQSEMAPPTNADQAAQGS